MKRKNILIIKGKLASLNDYTKACRAQGKKGYLAGSQMKRTAENRIKKCITEQFKGGKFKSPISVKFRWYEPDKKRDLDNICFAKKFIFDALVKSGTINGDGWRDVQGFTDEFFVDKNNPRIEVEILEV